MTSKTIAAVTTLLLWSAATLATFAADPPKTVALDLGEGVTLTATRIPAGKFVMGDATDKILPPHEVTISKPFYMGIHEVTRGQFLRIMGSDPSQDLLWLGSNPARIPADPQQPVQNATWFEAVEFCGKVSALVGRTVRLPTEAEWEYAARAGTTTSWSFGNDVEEVSDYAWGSQNSLGHQTRPVGMLKPNPWGLYDTYANLWEMCSDWYAPYDLANTVDPRGPGEPSRDPRVPGGARADVKVTRGGSYYSGFGNSTMRYAFVAEKDHRKPHVGFRIVVNAD